MPCRKQLKVIGVDERVMLALHTWGSALGFIGRTAIHMHPWHCLYGSHRPELYVEKVGDKADVFRLPPSPEGEPLILGKNISIELILRTLIQRDLGGAEMTA
jgi:hypothetical protein